MLENTNMPKLSGYKLNTLALAVAAVLPISVSYAEEIKELPTAQAEVKDEKTYKVYESTSLKYTQPLVDTAKTITIIPETILKDRNVDSLRDALRNVSGISVAAGEGGAPPGDSLTIRGFSSTNNITIDNVRDVAGYTRDIYNVEAVEVAKGPGSAVYGRGSAGGSVNLQTKTAKLDQFNDVSLRLGSEGDYRAKLDSNTKINDTTALRVNLLSDDVDVAGRDEVYNSKNAIALSLATGLETDSRLTINAEYQKQDNLPDYGLPWVSNGAVLADDLVAFEGGEPPVPYSNFYGNVNRDFEDVTAKSVTVSYEKDLNPSTIFRVLGRLGTVDRVNVVTAPRFISVDGITGFDSTIRLDDEKTRDTKNGLAVLQADLLGSYELNNMQHDVVAGIEIAQETFERWNYEAVVEDNLLSLANDFYNPDPNLEFTGQYARTNKSDDATADTLALYVFDTVTINSQWQVSAGLRYDMFDTEYFNQLDDDTDPNATIETSEDELSWNLGVVFKPAKNGSIYFGVGNAFTSSAEDITASTNGNSASLDPEETVSYELGTKWVLFDEKVNASAAIFHTEKTNALTDAADSLFSDDDGRFDTLDGEQRITGLELGLSGQFTEQLNVLASYTYQDSEVSKAANDDFNQQGNELARTPEHSFSLWGRYQVNEKLAFGLGAEYVGERYNSSSATGRELAEDYLIFDMMVSYEASKNLSLQFNASNLTDEEYADQLGGGHFIPGQGRYATLTAVYSF